MSVMGGLSSAQVGAMLRAGGYPANSGAWMTAAVTNVIVPAPDVLYLYWVPIARPILIRLLRTRCTAGGAGSAVKFALWKTDPTSGRPIGVPFIGQNAGLSTAASNSWQDLAVPSVPTDANGVWFGSKFTGTLPTMITCSASNSTAAAMSFPAGTMPSNPSGNFSLADAYANDILALDLTAAPLTAINNSIPAVALEWA